MKIMKRVFICVCVTVLLFILIWFMVAYFMSCGKAGTEYPFPESGTWHCEELGITLFLDTGRCVISKDNDTIKCSMLRERWSCKVYIHCYEFNNPDYEFEHLFFSGDFLEINGDVFYIKDHKSKTVYTFCKVIE